MIMLDGLAILILNGEFLFLGYPLIRKYLAVESRVVQLFYSHILSVSLMTLILWLSYLTGSLNLILIITTLLILSGLAGTSLFGICLVRRLSRRTLLQYLSFEGVITGIVIIGAAMLSLVSGLLVPFKVEGDPYYFYVPIGRYLNEHPGTYFDSFYRFFLSRNLGSYAMYAHADFLGRILTSSEVYRFLSMPFVMGSLLGVLSVARKMIQNRPAVVLSVVVFVASVYFELLVKYNQFYLGNVAMISLSLFFCHFLLCRSTGTLQVTILVFSTFAISLLYDLAFLLTIPFAIAYLAISRPRPTLYLVVVLGSLFIAMFAFVGLISGIFQVQQPGLVSLLALSALLAVLVLTIRPLVHSSTVHPPMGIKPVVVTLSAGAVALISQGLVNLWTLGFLSASTLTFSDPVRTYMTRNSLFVATTPDILWSIASLLFSSVFFGWGLSLTIYGLHRHRRSPVAIFFLSALPMFLVIQSLDRNYFRYELFIGSLIAVFLAIGLLHLLHGSALFVALFASIVTLSLRYIIVFPSLDYEHRVFPDAWQVLLQMVLVSPLLYNALVRRAGRQGLLRMVPTVILRFLPKTSVINLRSFVRSRAIATIMLLLAMGLLAANVLTLRYAAGIYTQEETQLNQNVLPLIEEKSRVLTVERVHRSLHFYKDIEVLELWQPWHLEEFLHQRINDTSGLLIWLRVNRIKYVLLDMLHVDQNPDVFGVFQGLRRCAQTIGCTISYDDGRFVLLEVARPVV